MSSTWLFRRVGGLFSLCFALLIVTAEIRHVGADSVYDKSNSAPSEDASSLGAVIPSRAGEGGHVLRENANALLGEANVNENVSTDGGAQHVSRSKSLSVSVSQKIEATAMQSAEGTKINKGGVKSRSATREISVSISYEMHKGINSNETGEEAGATKNVSGNMSHSPDGSANTNSNGTAESMGATTTASPAPSTEETTPTAGPPPTTEETTTTRRPPVEQGGGGDRADSDDYSISVSFFVVLFIACVLFLLIFFRANHRVCFTFIRGLGGWTRLSRSPEESRSGKQGRVSAEYTRDSNPSTEMDFVSVPVEQGERTTLLRSRKLGGTEAPHPRAEEGKRGHMSLRAPQEHRVRSQDYAPKALQSRGVKEGSSDEWGWTEEEKP